jgi:hypothetical protein
VATTFESIDAPLAEWLQEQPVFFVATAPLDRGGLVNCSPKGTPGTFRVLDASRVGYLDLTGSGVETIAHLRENGRIVVMFCAFDGRPRIVRLHGRGRVVTAADPAFDELVGQFSAHPGVRSVIVVDVTRISESCGYAVPVMDYREDRHALDATSQKKGEDGLRVYRNERNAVSLDGLPGLDPVPTP